MSGHSESRHLWGAHWKEGRASFSIWAPAAKKVQLELDGAILAMQNSTPGAWTVEAECTSGTPYRFQMQLEDELQDNDYVLSVADPASRLQQSDVDSDSLVYDSSAYAWQCPDWQGRPWHEAVIYELHVGTLGGFSGVTARLAGLAALGITAVELMPVGDFPGPRNWGYDGVLPFAPDTAYGTPADLKCLIDTAHGLGLMVLLDVVYNHFGPDGNFLHQYAPEFFQSGASTAWGGAIDFSQPQVRSFFTANAIYWINEFHFDGLRIDAAHAIASQDWLPEMAKAVRAAAGQRHIHLVLEHDGNAAGLLKNGFDAQWNDDAHHVMHVLLTAEKDGYYGDYADCPAERLARCMAEGFDYQGEPSSHRAGKARGEPSGDLPPTAFVFFLQNHDQTGNRAFGERLTTLANPAALRAAQAFQLLAPHIPLLFMGEESARTEPFLYFTSHRTAELAEAVRSGRLQEFSASPAFADKGAHHSIADPNDEDTFLRSVPLQVGEDGDDSTQWVRDLLALRHQFIIPGMAACWSLGAQPLGPAAIRARWQLGRQILTLIVNLGETPLMQSAGNSGPALTFMQSAAQETLFDTGNVRRALATGVLPGHSFLALVQPV